MRRASALLALLFAGCTTERVFVEPLDLHDYRPDRTATIATPDAAEDDALRRTPPPLLDRRAHSAAPPLVVTLSNGVEVVMVERHEFPSVTAELLLDRGTESARPGVAEIYTSALRGSVQYDELATDDYLAHVGATIRRSCEPDYIALSVTALSPLFLSALSRAAPLFVSPALRGKEVDLGRAGVLSTASRRAETPSAEGEGAMLAALFPEHPYGRSALRLEPFRAVTDDDLRRFRDDVVAAEHLSVTVVGDFQPAGMQRMLEAALGKVPRRGARPLPPAPEASGSASAKVLVVDRPGAVQSNVILGFRGPSAAAADLASVEVLGHASAGTLSTRLNLKLRQELGATYGVQFKATGLRAGGVLEISTALETTQTGEALSRLLGELARLRSEPLEARELATAKLRAYDALESASDAALARYLGRRLVRGTPPGALVAHDVRIDLVTAEDVRRAASRYLAMDGAVLVVVGDLARIGSGLSSLGLGAPVVIR